MFTPKALSGSEAEKYYEHLNERDGYYTAKEEPPGRWLGKGAEALGLAGVVRAKEFKQTMNGRLGDRQLVRNAGKAGRMKAIDAPVSVPKSVSAAYAASDKDGRAAIDRALDRAARKVVERVESIVETRSGAGGKNKEKGAKLIVAAFKHDTNRKGEPGEHVHLVFQNVAVRKNGSTATPDFRPLFREQKSIGAFFRRELARELEREGFAVVAREGLDEKGRKYQSFEMRDVPQKLVDVYSERARELQAEHERTGESKNLINRRTREKKQAVPRAELEEQWRAQQKEALGHDRPIDFRTRDAERADLGKLDVAALPREEREQAFARLREEREARRTEMQRDDKMADSVSLGARAAKGLAAAILAARSAQKRPKQADTSRAIERIFESEN